MSWTEGAGLYDPPDRSRAEAAGMKRPRGRTARPGNGPAGKRGCWSRKGSRWTSASSLGARSCHSGGDMEGTSLPDEIWNSVQMC